MQWYYSADGAAVGPRTADDLEELYAAAEIAADTLVWRKGFAEWTPLGDTEDFAPLIDAGLPPPLPQARRLATAYGTDDEEPAADHATRRFAGDHRAASDSALTAATVAPVFAGPWTRFFARSIDITILLTLLIIGLYLVPPAVSPGLSLQLNSNPGALLLPLLLVALLLNAVIITLCGNSLGKAIFGIRAEPIEGDWRFGLDGNLKREFRVWVWGLALGLPLVSFFTLVPAFHRVLRGTPTAYDLGRATVRAYSQSRFRRTLGMLFALLPYLGILTQAAIDLQVI